MDNFANVITGVEHSIKSDVMLKVKQEVTDEKVAKTDNKKSFSFAFVFIEVSSMQIPTLSTLFLSFSVNKMA